MKEMPKEFWKVRKMAYALEMRDEMLVLRLVWWVDE